MNKMDITHGLDANLVEAALRTYICELDYDIHKNLERGEDDDKDTYPDEAAAFMAAYHVAWASSAA